MGLPINGKPIKGSLCTIAGCVDDPNRSSASSQGKLNTWNFYPNLMYPSVEICLLIWENAAAFNQTIVWELPRQKTCLCPFYIFLHVSFLFANEQKLQYHCEGPRRTTSKSTWASQMMSNAWFHYFAFFPTTAQRSAFKSTPIGPSLLSNQLGLHVPKAMSCDITRLQGIESFAWSKQQLGIYTLK